MVSLKLFELSSRQPLARLWACAKTWTMDDFYLAAVKTLKPAHFRSCTLLSFIAYFVVYYNTNIAILVTENGFSVRFTAKLNCYLILVTHNLVAAKVIQNEI
jgi:hypothetical protein